MVAYFHCEVRKPKINNDSPIVILNPLSTILLLYCSFDPLREPSETMFLVKKLIALLTHYMTCQSLQDDFYFFEVQNMFDIFYV